MDSFEEFLQAPTGAVEPKRAAGTGQPAPEASAPGDDFERFLSGGEDAQRLKLSVQEGAKVPPDVAQRVLRMQLKTGLPKDFVARNLDEVERESSHAGFDAETYRKTSPAAAAWVAAHPDHAAAAREDLTKLNYLERQLRYIGAQKEIGELQDELMGIGERSMNETAGPKDRARQATIEARLRELEAFNAGTDITGFFEQMPGVAIQQWPVNKRVIGSMAEGATKGLVLGAAGGGAMAGAPGAVAGGLTMLGPSALVGGGMEAGRVEMHSALLEYEKLTDANGQPLDRTTIKGLALMAGAANGTLEMLFGLEPLMLKVPGVRSLTRGGLTELLKTPTSRDALLRFGRTIGQTMAEEGATEALQMYVTKLGGAIAQTMQDGGSILDRVFTSDTAAQALQEARAGAQGGGGMAAPMAAVTAMADLKRAKEAQRMRQAFGGIGDMAAQTKLRESLPGTLRAIIEQATKEGPVETLYLPVDSFTTYFQSKGADPREVAAALTGSAEEYDQAVASGRDLAVKTADYVEHLAGTEHNAFFAQEVRPSLSAMNAREADAWIEDQINHDVLPGVQTAAAEDPAAKVRQDIAGQLEALGFDPSVVDQYAQLYQSRYQARAERRGLGENAFDLFRRSGLTVQRVLPDILKKVGGQTTEMDALLDRLRGGDVPKPGEIYGKSLLDALREIGLQDQGGEVSAIEPDHGRLPFQKKLIREDGWTLDRAAERMHEAGYLSERSIEELLEGMRQEVSGRPVYVPGAENPVLLDVSEKLEDLRRYLLEQGVDLAATPNEQVKAMFERLLSAEESQAVGQDAEPGDGETFEQTALPDPAVPTFYLKVEQVVAEKMGGKAKVGELLKMLAANQVKEDELKWTGLDDFLKGKETVTKAEVQQFLENNRVEIKVVTLGGKPGLTETEFWAKNQELVAKLREIGWETAIDPEAEGTGAPVGRVAFYQPDDDGMMGDLLTWDELPDGARGSTHSPKYYARLIDESLKGTESQPKFAQHKEPGGEHYREILLALPAKTRMVQPAEVVIGRRDNAWVVKSPDGRQTTRIPAVIGGTPVSEAEAREYATQMFNRAFEESRDEFVAGHYQVPNVLAHVRVDDRIDAQGRRVLFVEEIQSDWHQKGRKQGYRKKWAQDEVDQFVVLDQGGDAWNVYDGDGNLLVSPPKHLNHSAEDALRTVRRAALNGTLHGMSKVPDAPFKKTWHELALKYLLRQAAEGRYDVMAWTTGQMQAERYDLSKQVEEVAYEKNTDGTYHLWVKPIGSQPTDQIRETDLSAVPEAGLADIVGKDLAEKMVAGEGDRAIDEARDFDIEQVTGATRTGDGSVIRWKDGSESQFDSPVEAKRALLDEYAKQLGVFDRGEARRRRFSGVDLKVGGSGMKGFYDKMVPTFLNKYGKKWGAKVEEVSLGEVGGKSIYTVMPTASDEAVFGVWVTAALHDDAFEPPLKEFTTRQEAERWVAEQTPNLEPVFREPVFREIAPVEWDAFAGATEWDNGDKPVIADVKVKIGDGAFEAEVVLSKEGMTIIGGDGGDMFEYQAPASYFAPTIWGTAAAAQRTVLMMWGDPTSDLWGAMGPTLGSDWIDPEDLYRIGPAGESAALSMEVQGLPITEAMKESVMKAGQPLFQSTGGKDAKGQITFGSGRIDIALLEKADLSTFIHETGHLYLNELVEDALTPGVPQQLRDDLDSILGWMGLSVRVADGAEAIKAAIGREQHEQFARGFEAYALEGKSPSLAMREVFAKFRQWLIQVYRLITYRGDAADPSRVGAALQVNLTPEVRKVMNRMVATEAEIQAMEAEASVEPMFTDAASAGMTDAEFAAYQEQVSKAGLLAREALQAQVLAQLARERTAWWKEKTAEMQAEVLAEANQRPVYIALSVLQDGTMPDGSALPEGLQAGKLSRQAVAALLGKDFVKKLPRGTTTASDGMTPDHAAWIFGYQSAEEFLTDLANVRPKKELVEAEAHHRMVREYGDPLIDGTLHDKARTAVLNAEREQVIEAELTAIDKKRREVTQGALAGLMPPPESVRRLAQEQIARQRVREISPQVHFLAAQRANKAATEALWKRDYLAAGLAKQKELLNLALYREATAAREEAERIVSHLRELRTKSRQEKIGKAGSDYLEQINAIMERYEFSPVPHVTLAKRQALREWIAEKEHEGATLGEEFQVPEEILFEARKMNYKELPFEELEGIRDTIQQIEHFARAQTRLQTEQALQEKEEVRALLIGQILAHTKKRLPQALTESSMTRGEKMSRLAERFNASLLKTEQLMDELDGGPEGPWHDYFWNPAVDAQAAEADYTERITGKIAEAVVNIPAAIRSRMLELVTVPGLPRPMSRKEIIGAALNVGNPSNKAKLLKGMGWSDRNLAEMLDHLTKDEWDFVQQVWDTLESMWPDIATLQKKLTGIAPEKVTIEPVQTKFGTYAGGYYPVMYAAALSAQGSLQLSNTFGRLLDDNYVKATLPSGYRKARIEQFAAPFDLDVDRLPSHIAGVVKDLTHRAWLIDANWIVSDKQIRAALKERLGEALTLRLADWVGQVANDRAGASSKTLAVWMQMIESFRMNTVIVAMGFKFSTMASQLAGVAPAIEAIGGKDGGGSKWFAVGVSDALRRPRSTYDFMTSKSGEMRHRIASRDRDLRDKLRGLQGRQDLLSQIQEVSLRGIGYMELMVSMPTWVGAYKKALDEGKTDEQAVRAGDRAVRLSQGAAGAKDLAAVAGRSDTMMRLLTMFYTPFSALYNRLRSIGHDVEGLEDLPRAAVRLWLTVTVAATLGELLAGHGPDKDEPWWRWWLRVQAMYPFLAVPLLRDAISTIVSGYGYQFSPVAQALETGTRFTRSAYQAAAGEKEWAELAEQSAKVFAYFAGLPTSQLLVTGKYLRDLATGQEHPDNIFQFARDLVYSRPKQ